MKSIWRQVGTLFLLALFISATWVQAQDSSTVTVVGSNLVAPLFESLKTSSGAALDATPEVIGTRAGFERLCAGQTDIALATRAISAEEALNCTTNNVDYTELLVAYSIVAFVTKPDASYATCLTPQNIAAIMAPSAQTTAWEQILPGAGTTPLAVILPQSGTLTFTTLDSFVEGDGFRPDATTLATDADVIAAVASTDGAVGVVNVQSAAAAADRVKILQLNENEAIGCDTPSAESVEQRAYRAMDPLFIYFNRASLSKPGVTEVLTYAISDAAASSILAAGLTVPTSLITGANQTALAGTGNTRPFSEQTTSFSIPQAAAGQVTIAGAAEAFDLLNNLGTAITAQYAGITLDLKTLGQPSGVRRLCNGEVDIAAITAPLTAEETQNCTANNIQTLPIDLGRQAVVLVSNAANSYLACLTTQQVGSVWSFSAADTIKTWNQVDASFPADAMTLFAPNPGDNAGDLLLTISAGKDVPVRGDSQLNNDPLFRAAATANVSGALTYMDWSEYQRVAQNNQQRIQLVGIDGGSGCVTPSAETIADGTYPLSRGATLLVNKASLTKIQVQSYLWYLASDPNFGQFERSGFIGVEAKPGAVCLTRDGDLWFGTARGATRVVPDQGDGAPTPP
ncbi:MAG: substrate-binding domain-containing protein, partial [Anaerolineae bacterium]|nr:substrate-binding domain-containing protein [Anaerolineae bacterium]